MAIIVGTYLPPWGTDRARVIGYDEDALTMAVEAGRLAIGDGSAVTKVVFISRELPLLEGGNSAPLIAALRLKQTVEVVEQIGGAPATLDALASATPGTLVIGVDAATSAGAAAAFFSGANTIKVTARVQRSMPHKTRHASGEVFSNDDDPRMLRELGTRASIEAAKLPAKPLVVAGLGAKDAASWSAPGAPALPTVGASSPIFAIAALTEAGRSGVIGACELGIFSAAEVDVSGGKVQRQEAPAQPPVKRKHTPGTGVKISLAAYERAFEAKVRWQAGKCKCGTLAMPPRFYCLTCGAEDSWEYTPLPYTGTIYTTATIHVPVPSLDSPYTLAVVQCGDTDVRVLMHVTDVPPATAKIGEHGRLVLRRVAMRTGIPDYGYAISPDLKAESKIGGAK